MSYKIEIHEESLILPIPNGVYLTPPGKTNTQQSLCIQDILKFPMNVYFQILGGIIVHCNEEVYTTHRASSLGFSSSKELIGLTPEKICKQEYVKSIKNNDLSVMQNKQMMLFEEDALPLKEEMNIPFLTLKFPCYLEENKDPIIFGLSILLDNSYIPSSVSLAEALSLILKSNFLKSPSFCDLNTLLSQRKIEDVYITQQQIKCLKFALKGMTAKKIAAQLGISFRTVEHHFEILKHKLKVKSKPELLEKVVDYFIN